MRTYQESRLEYKSNLYGTDKMECRGQLRLAWALL